MDGMLRSHGGTNSQAAIPPGTSRPPTTERRGPARLNLFPDTESRRSSCLAQAVGSAPPAASTLNLLSDSAQPVSRARPLRAGASVAAAAPRPKRSNFDSPSRWPRRLRAPQRLISAVASLPLPVLRCSKLRSRRSRAGRTVRTAVTQEHPHRGCGTSVMYAALPR